MQITKNRYFSFKAYDGNAYSNTSTVSITVSSVNDIPVVNDVSESISEDSELESTLADYGSDSDEDVLTYSVVVSPSHGDLNLIVDGTYVYTPEANYTGEDTFTFKAYDGIVYSNISTVTIEISGQNDAPVITNGSTSTLEDTQLSSTVSVYGSDPERSALSYSLVARCKSWGCFN